MITTTLKGCGKFPLVKDRKSTSNTGLLIRGKTSFSSQLWLGSSGTSLCFDEETNFISEKRPLEEKWFQHSSGLSAVSSVQR